LLLIAERQNWKDTYELHGIPELTSMLEERTNTESPYKNTGSQTSLSRPKITDHISLETPRVPAPHLNHCAAMIILEVHRPSNRLAT